MRSICTICFTAYALIMLAGCGALLKGSYDSGRYYSADNLIGVSPPPLKNIDIKDGYDESLDRSTGVRSSIGWVDFSPSKNIGSTKEIYSVEWLDIRLGPIKNNEDFYSRGTWYLNNYIQTEYRKHFQANINKRETLREKILIGEYPAIRVIIQGDFENGNHLTGAITLIGMSNVIVNAQVISFSSGDSQDDFTTSEVWKLYNDMVSSVHPAD